MASPAPDLVVFYDNYEAPLAAGSYRFVLQQTVNVAVATLDDKIERVEKKQREKAAEPTPLTLQVKHTHGGLLGGSCTGTLTINATGVRYDGQHVFASNLVGTGVSLTKDEMEIKFQGSSQKFRVTRAEAERVREAIARYQQTYSPVSK